MSEHEQRHRWDVTTTEAIAIQRSLREEVVKQDAFEPVQFVAGVDIGFEDGGATTRAAVAVLRFPELTLHETSVVRRPTTFPYVPGLLSFREVPASLDALAQLTTRPDLLLCDGQGYAHPRRFGLACHLGLLSDIPAIGVAKSLLTGKHAPVLDERGAFEPLIAGDEVIGVALRTRVGTKPIFVSIGNRISLESAITMVMRCTTRYRLPETTRHAHSLASYGTPLVSKATKV